MTTKTVYIIRHCQASGQESDAPLTELGVEQANQLAEFLSGEKIDYIVSSPYERAVRTIAPLADKLGIEIVMDDRLAERVLSGKSNPDWLEMLRRTFDDLDLCYEGGESSRVAMTRAVQAVMEIVGDGSPYRNAIVVSHGNLITLLLKFFDNRIGFMEWEKLSNPDVYCLTVGNDTPVIQRIWKD